MRILLLTIMFMNLLSSMEVHQYSIFEHAVHSDLKYDNPFWDVTVQAEFTAPNGERIAVNGFYYDQGEWRIRFVPRTIGAWTWTLRLNSDQEQRSASGAFRCVSGSQRGFLKVSSQNPYRMEYDNGDPAYLIGYQHGGDLLAGHDGPRKSEGQWRSVDLETLLKDYDGAANLTRVNMDSPPKGSFSLIKFGQKDLTQYDLRHAAVLDKAFALYKQYGVALICVPFQDMSMYGAYQTPFGHVRDNRQYKSLESKTLPAQERYLKYVVSRYSAYVDIWELHNEDSYARPAYIEHLINIIRQADPHKHIVTTNGEHPDKDFCEILCPHTYVSTPAERVDLKLIDDFLRMKAYGKPIQYTEFGNKPTFSNYDPVKWRIVTWTCFTREVGMLFWSMSGFIVDVNPNKNGNNNMYFGPESRKYFSILLNLAKDLPVDMRPVVCSLKSGDGSERIAGLGNGQNFIIYLHQEDHAKVYTPEDLNIHTGEGRFKVRWISPESGKELMTYTTATHSQYLNVRAPRIQIDAVCLLERVLVNDERIEELNDSDHVLYDFEHDHVGFAVEKELTDYVSKDLVSINADKKLVVRLEPHKWPGIYAHLQTQDWSTYTALKFDIITEDQFRLRVRIDDATSKDARSRFGQSFALEKGSRTLRVAIADIAARLDSKHITKLYFFSSDVFYPQQFTIDNIRLVK